MMRVRLYILTVVMLLVPTSLLRAQLSKVAVVDFERAVVESVEGKKASDKFNSQLQAKQTEMEKRQKELDDQQKKLQAGARTLNDAAKAEIQKDIDRRTTELKRLNEDAERELQGLRDELLRPIAERATEILQAMAVEQDYTLVVDISNPENNVRWFNPKNDITADLIKRIDAEASKEPATSTAPKAPATNAPATSRPASPPATAPKTQTPAPTVRPKQP